MSGVPHVSYAARPGAMPETEISALSNVYRFILDCQTKKEGCPETAPDAGKEINE